MKRQQPHQANGFNSRNPQPRNRCCSDHTETLTCVGEDVAAIHPEVPDKVEDGTLHGETNPPTPDTPLPVRYRL